MKLAGRTRKPRMARLYPRTARATKQPKPTYVAFGVTRNGSCRGARFSDLDLAIQAALSLKLELFEAVSIEMRKSARELPTGVVYGSDRAFLPIITKGLYKKLYVAFGGLVRDGSSERFHFTT